MKKAMIYLLFFVCTNAFAQYNLSESLRLSGFGTLSVSRSDSSVPIFTYRDIKDETCYDCDTTLGLQGDWLISDTLRSSVQIVKRPQDHFSDPELEWAYLAYTKGDLTAKVGRQRLPFFISSEYYYVSAAYPWARAPHNVYDNVQGMTHYDGLALEQQFWLSDQTQIKISPYLATKDKNDFELYGQEFGFETTTGKGLAIDLYKDENQLHFSYFSATADNTKNGYLLVRRKLNLISLGFKTIYDNFSLSLETLYQKDLLSNWYIGLAQEQGEFSPYVQYGEGHENYKNRSYLAGVRYNISPKVKLNLEWEYVQAPKTNANGFFSAIQLGNIDGDSNIVSLSLSFLF
ncbi:outer membrane protein [Vibrio quintilis]|uniref:Porin domain-containing protein n=1 Tax=Vibrio quintilis TaxID=1117707 RepID=A0A1M7Z0Z7_9VIBR|nr:hypothetical protein [Vibrio quintilis]SHO58628.1 hypothetical protein VQ7734_04400 [Vibrio quintilis]